jgi:predicted nuclease with TOPRIM domain
MDERTREERRNDEMTIRTLMQQNATLQSECNRLKEKIDELEADLEAAEAEAEENKHAQMADATTSTIGQLAQVLPAIVDKYFAIQEQKNALLAEQMMRQRPPMRPQPQQPVPGPQNGEYYYEGQD